MITIIIVVIAVVIVVIVNCRNYLRRTSNCSLSYHTLQIMLGKNQR